MAPTGLQATARNTLRTIGRLLILAIIARAVKYIWLTTRHILLGTLLYGVFGVRLTEHPRDALDTFANVLLELPFQKIVMACLIILVSAPDRHSWTWEDIRTDFELELYLGMPKATLLLPFWLWSFGGILRQQSIRRVSAAGTITIAHFRVGVDGIQSLAHGGCDRGGTRAVERAVEFRRSCEAQRAHGLMRTHDNGL
ncbi:uncharacterized protein LTR77_008360 [Saxophila tyrrhenica]|uniref:Uncharacterized protein n=1 Tax=Saxophila tyrrhenica TaxID=1690608 RepID=A0AAV9P0Q4_9PEZI|nr:hypothetical protein LTR77_008360 [Saxophila tyrrhenica]